jgi:RNA polymerase sigma-70 factor (ECF subfamily)
MELETFKIQVLASQRKLLRFACNFLTNEAAEDIVQDVLMKLWDMRDQLDRYHSVEALAMRMVKNRCLDRRKAKASQVQALDTHHYNLASEAIAPDRNLELNNAVKMVQQAIQQLPEMQRLIIQMRDVEEMEFEEIAEILQTDLNYIRVNLSRARKKIREILTQLHNYGNATN